MSNNKLKVDLGNSHELVELLERIPKLVVAQGGPTDRAVKKASTIIARRARQVAPRAKYGKNGRRLKQSKKSAEDWPNKIHEVIRTKTVKYPTSSFGIIGPKSPEGNAAHFMQEKSRKHVLWGKIVKTYRIARNWIVRAYDETKGEQQAAMVASLRTDIDKIMRS